MVSRFPLILLLVFLLTGCVTAPPTPTAAPVIESSPTPSPAPTVTPDLSSALVRDVRNAQYQLGAVEAIRVVELTNGVYQTGTPGGPDYVSVNMLNYTATGDLNGDGSDEVAALVSENYGGSGVFVFLVVYAKVNGTLTFQSSLMVDDRPQVDSLSIENGEIALDVVIHGLEDPMCCPTFRTLRHYRLADNAQITSVSFSTFTPAGDPRVITIEAPVSGVDVYSSVQVRGNVTIAPFENTLAYHIYDVGGVELAAGAVDVTAAELGGPGTFDSIIKLGNILSGAVIRLEIRDTSAENGSLLAMDSIELVVK